MPQMNKGGKFIFGKSLIQEDGVLQFPEQAIQEYDITEYFMLRKALNRTKESTISLHGKHQRATRKALAI